MQPRSAVQQYWGSCCSTRLGRAHRSLSAPLSIAAYRTDTCLQDMVLVGRTHTVRRTEFYRVLAWKFRSTLSIFLLCWFGFKVPNTKHVLSAAYSVSRHDTGTEWLPSLFCESCITTLIKRQWPIYEESLAKANCKVSVWLSTCHVSCESNCHCRIPYTWCCFSASSTIRHFSRLTGFLFFGQNQATANNGGGICGCTS